MGTFWSIVIALIIIAILIFFHELGHFIAARRVGIPVHEFSLGFGYQLLGTKRGGTQYSLRLIPLGGYVRMAGEEPGDMENPLGYNTRTPLEKIRVTFAGPFMNFVLAALIFIYIFAVIGVGVPVNEAIIGDVLKDKPAYEAGLKAGDKILAVNDQKVGSWNEFVEKIQTNPAGKSLQLTISRNQETKVVKLTPERDKSTGQSIVGVYSKIVYERRGIIEAVKLGFVRTYQMTVLMLQSLGMLFTGGVSTSDIAGPVGITSMVGEAARSGMVSLLTFTAFLSINLGLLNLMPIPALDGSRILFSLVEIIRRKPLDPEKEGYIHWVGFMFLMLIMLLATYNDIVRIIKG